MEEFPLVGLSKRQLAAGLKLGNKRQKLRYRHVSRSPGGRAHNTGLWLWYNAVLWAALRSRNRVVLPRKVSWVYIPVCAPGSGQLESSLHNKSLPNHRSVICCDRVVKYGHSIFHLASDMILIHYNPPRSNWWCDGWVCLCCPLCTWCRGAGPAGPLWSAPTGSTSSQLRSHCEPLSTQ